MSTLIALLFVGGWGGLGYLGWRIGIAATAKSLRRIWPDYHYVNDGYSYFLLCFSVLCGPIGLLSAALFAALEDRQ